MLESAGLAQTARDGWNQQNFVAFLEGIGLSAEESDVFLIHIDIEEAANLALIVAQVRPQIGKFLVENRE